jgi:hypothetical protein
MELAELLGKLWCRAIRPPVYLRQLVAIGRSLSGAIVVLLGLAPPLHAQANAAVGVGFGLAEGPDDQQLVFDLAGRVRLVDRLFAVGGASAMSGWGRCGASVSCEYYGKSITAGLALAILDSDRGFGSLRGAVGAFNRSAGEVEFRGTWHFTWSVGIETEVRLAGPLAFQTSGFYRYVHDEVYSEIVGTAPTFTGASVGMALHLDHRDDGG